MRTLLESAWIFVASMWLSFSIIAGLFIWKSYDGSSDGAYFFKDGKDIYCFSLIADSYDEDFE